MLYKRRRKDGSYGPTWWTRFVIGKREVRVSCGTPRKALAEEFERRLRDQLWRESALGEVLHTWEEAKERWLQEKANKRSIKRDKQAFAILDPLLTGLALVDFDEEKVAECEKALAVGRKPRTVIRITAVLRAVLRRAMKRWKWVAAVPEFEKAPKSQPTVRWATPEQFEVLWRELPAHARQIVRFAVSVGPRSGNIFRLKWSGVDMEKAVFRVDGEDFKSDRPVGFPLPAEALEVLRQQRGAHPVYVFTDQRGRAPVGSIKTCWGKARKRAGLPGFRVHDLRHTFAAWHKLAGTPDHALQSLGGWSDIRMVKRYGHINPQDYAHFADNRRTKSGTEGSGK